MSLVKKTFGLTLVLLLLLLAAWVWWMFSGGVSHVMIYDRVGSESANVQRKIDERCDAIDRKLDRIESKLDRILEIANRPMADGMQPASDR